MSHQPLADLGNRYASVLAGKRPRDHPYAPGADTPWWVKGVREGDWQERDFPGVEIRKVDMKPYNKDIGRPEDQRQLSLYSLIGSIDSQDLNLHACAHLYASDRNSLFQVTTVLDIAEREDLAIAMASLSHTVVFHFPLGGEELRMEDEDEDGGSRKRWFVQEAWIPRSADNRGMHESRIWDEKGLLIASTWQDGMVRVKKDASGIPLRERKWSKI